MDPITLGALIYGGSKVAGGITDYFGNQAQLEKEREAARIRNEGYDKAQGIGNEYFQGLENEYGQDAATYRGDLDAWRKQLQGEVPTLGEFNGGKYNIQNYLDPSMAFQQKQMGAALENSASKSGSLYSGATAKALQANAANLAQQDYANAFQRMQGDRDFGYRNYMDKFNAARLTAADKISNLSSLVNQSGSARNALFDTRGKRADLGMNTVLAKAGVNADKSSMEGRAYNANWQSAGNVISDIGGYAANKYGGKGAK